MTERRDAKPPVAGLIREAEAADIPQVTALHCRELNCRLTDLGPRVVADFYLGCLERRVGVLLVAEHHGRIAGFVHFVENSAGLFQRALGKGPFAAFRILLRSRKRGLIRFLVGARDLLSEKDYLHGPEMIYLAVDPNLRGYGFLLVRAADDYFRRRGFDHYELAVSERNKAAQFFEMCGFRRTEKIPRQRVVKLRMRRTLSPVGPQASPPNR